MASHKLPSLSLSYQHGQPPRESQIKSGRDCKTINQCGPPHLTSGPLVRRWAGWWPRGARRGGGGLAAAGPSCDGPTSHLTERSVCAELCARTGGGLACGLLDGPAKPPPQPRGRGPRGGQRRPPPFDHWAAGLTGFGLSTEGGTGGRGDGPARQVGRWLLAELRVISDRLISIV
jgi:hypothetical protein